MADHIVETRILLRYGTYSEWMNSDVILKPGEAAIATFPYSNTLYQTDDYPERTPPAVGIKIGNGQKYFRELPWVQAVAADVYNWAKDAVKPTYTAQEIQGLQGYIANYMDEHGGGSGGEVTIAPRLYRLVEGTGVNENKFYLEYKENNENSSWIIDTSRYIDLSDLVQLKEWIGDDINEYFSLAGRTEAHIQYDLGFLNHNDQEVNKTFVTSVSQTNGQISVTKKELEVSDLTGTVEVSQGGTGKTTLNADEVLVGNGTSPIKTIPIAEEIGNNNYIVPNYVIKNYVDSAVAGLTGAMHFRGEATVVITPGSSVNPQISGYNFAEAIPGDVILFETKEFVWTGADWHLLGDEGSYAVKGSIKDADIDADAAIQQSKIANLIETFNTKVDKVEGKTLTSNDFTDELLDKLNNIAANAQVNTIEHILVNGTEVPPTVVYDTEKKSVDLQISEFDSASQSKLASIENGAEVNIIQGIIYGNETLSPNENRIITITPDSHEDHINKIEKIIYDGVEITPDNNKAVIIAPNPHTDHENVIEHVIYNGSELIPDANKSITITPDPHTEHENTIERIIYDGAEITPENKVITITPNHHPEHVNIIEKIYYDGREITPDANKAISITSNPHTEHENKIEKIVYNGVELTPNEQKTVTISPDPHTEHENVIEKIIYDGTELVPNNKTVTITSPVAHENKIEKIIYNGTELVPDGQKAVTITPIEHPQYENKIEKIIYDGSELIPNEQKIVSINSDPHTEHINVIEHIIYDGVELQPNGNKTITITPDPHTEHENVIEQIFINGTEYEPENKVVNITLDQAALNLNVLEGATIPQGNTTTDVTIVNKKLELARIAATGDVSDLLQTQDTYIIFDCGSSTDVI